MTVTHLERVGYRAVLSLDCRDAIRPPPAAPGGQVLGAAVNDLAAWAWPETEPDRSSGAIGNCLSASIGL